MPDKQTFFKKADIVLLSKNRTIKSFSDGYIQVKEILKFGLRKKGLSGFIRKKRFINLLPVRKKRQKPDAPPIIVCLCSQVEYLKKR